MQFHYVILGKLDRIGSMDMGTLMCNLLSNAAEACLKKETERFIEVIFREENGRVEVRLENSLEGSVLTDNPQLKSRKEDRERYRVGMETIYDVIRKYREEYSCRKEKGSFVQEILMYYESPEKERNHGTLPVED